MVEVQSPSLSLARNQYCAIKSHKHGIVQLIGNGVIEATAAQTREEILYDYQQQSCTSLTQTHIQALVGESRGVDFRESRCLPLLIGDPLSTNDVVMVRKLRRFFEARYHGERLIELSFRYDQNLGPGA